MRHVGMYSNETITPIAENKFELVAIAQIKLMATSFQIYRTQ